MKELNNLFSKACLASELGKKGITVDVTMLSQVRDEFRALEQRAEAAEAALAEERRINSKLREDRAGLARECNAFEAKLAAARGVKKSWQERAWTAEEKLAELDKQPPVGYTNSDGIKALSKGFMVTVLPDTRQLNPLPLFTRPAPAINLAELVPPEDEGWQTDEFKSGRNSMRADILRNIEEQSK